MYPNLISFCSFEYFKQPVFSWALSTSNQRGKLRAKAKGEHFVTTV